MLSKVRLEIFWKNIKKGPKIHCLALKLYTGPPNCITGASKLYNWGLQIWGGGQEGLGLRPPLDPLVIYQLHQSDTLVESEKIWSWYTREPNLHVPFVCWQNYTYRSTLTDY